jgi:hypothetical protein
MKKNGMRPIFPFRTFHFELELRLGFLVRRVLAAEPAVLIQVQLVGRVALVLGRRIVFPLALAAGEKDDLTHFRSLSLSE